MFFQLSKDKTLHSVLLKYDLDSETKELVENQASAAMIKDSLIKNIDATNVVIYRKLIEKAILKQKEDEDYGEFAGDTRYASGKAKERQERKETLQGQSEREQAEQESFKESDRLRQSTMLSAEQREKSKEETEHRRAQNEIKFLLNAKEKVNDLIRNVRIQTNLSPPAITGASAYRDISKRDSNFLIKVLRTMSTLPEFQKGTETNFIVNRFKQFSFNGEFPIYSKKMYKREKGERTIKNKVTSEINIFDLNNTYSALANSIIDNTPSNKEMSVIEIMGMLHLRAFNSEAKALADVGRIARDFSGFKTKIAEKDAKGYNVRFRRAVASLNKTLQNIENHIKYLNNSNSSLKNTLEEFETVDDDYLLEYAEDLVTDKARELAVSLKVFTVKEGSNEMPEYIRDLREEIKTLRENPEEKLDDLRMDLANQWVEVKEDYEKIYNKFNMKFVKSLISEINLIKQTISSAGEIKDPSKELSKKIRQIRRPIRKLFSKINSLTKALDELDDETKEKWKEFLKEDSESLKDLEADKPKKRKKGENLASSVGYRIDRTMRILMEVSEDQAKNKFTELGIDFKNVQNINVPVSEIEEMIQDISSDRADIDSDIKRRKKEDAEQEVVAEIPFDYDIPSWIEEDFDPERQMGGKKYKEGFE